LHTRAVTDVAMLNLLTSDDQIKIQRKAKSVGAGSGEFNLCIYLGTVKWLTP